MKRSSWYALLILLFVGASIPPVQAKICLHRGKIKMLRVHDLGTGYGPDNNFIDVEVVITFQNRPGIAYGFQLRNDEYLPARQGMLNLLRDAFKNDWSVTINYDTQFGYCPTEPIEPNGTIIRVELVK